MAKELKVDAEFCELLGPLSKEESDQLRANLIEEGGARESIKVWANHDDTIIDGHNRYAICVEEGLRFKVEALTFPDRAAVMRWMYENQRGRRNLTAERLRLLRGKLYNETKKPHGGARKPAENSSPQNEDLKKTAASVGEEFGVSRQTIERDARRAASLQHIDPSVREQILDGKLRATQEELDALNEHEHDVQRAIVADMQQNDARTVTRAIEAYFEDDGQAAAEVPAVDVRIDGHNKSLESIARLCVKATLDAIKLVDTFDISRRQIVEDQLKSAAATIRADKAHKPCPKCGGDGCGKCKQRGFMNKVDYESNAGRAP